MPPYRGSLDAKISKSQTEEETIATSRIACRLVVAPPSDRERQAVIIIGKAKTVADRLITVRN
jgi:hypothetical protein